jgi:sodium transport system permease protein
MKSKALPAYLQVYLKEIREMMRDKRVRNGALVTPIAVVILMVALFGTISASIGQKSKQRIGLVASSSPLAATLKASPRLEVTGVDSPEDGKKLIEKGKSHLVVQIDPAGQNGQIPVDMYFDNKEDSSEIAKAVVKKTLEPYYLKQQASVLSAHGLAKENIEPIAYSERPVQVGEGAGAGGFIVAVLPYLLVLFTFTGGFSVAGDLVAGEKERSTLETLLITPVSRTEIVIGKFLALCSLCLASGLSGVVGLVIGTKLPIPGADAVFTGGFEPKAALVIVVSILPLVAFFAALLVAVSSYARNTREAQTYLSMVYILVLIPAVFSQVLGVTDLGSQIWVNFVPVLNTAANIRTALQGKAQLGAVLEAVAVGLLLGAVMLRVAVHLFNREQVLQRI